MNAGLITLDPGEAVIGGAVGSGDKKLFIKPIPISVILLTS